MIVAPSFSSAMIANTGFKAAACFVYGTLMSPEVLKVLLGRVPSMVPSAILHNHSRHPVRGQVFPGVIPTPASSSSTVKGVVSPTTINAVEGVLLLDISPLEIKCLDWFEEEGVAYTRSNVQVSIPSLSNLVDQTVSKNINIECSDQQTIETNAYIWALGTSKLDLTCNWDYNAFLSEHLEWYLDTTVKPCRIEIEKTIL
ncbi:hypothetical protein ACHAXR_001098 [Thalassiosira sp. AJA248-18]